MYGKGAGTLNVATGISLLPDTGNNHLLFIVAVSLLVTGIAIFTLSTVLTHKRRQTEV